MQRDNFIFSSEIAWETVGEGVRRQIMGYDERIMTVKVEFQTGSVGYVHKHEHVQTTYVVSGAFEFQVGEETKIVKAGDGLYMEPNVMHGVKCLEEGLLIDTFNPVREDFLKK
ncbi:MAG: cupin domain-containing protein [Paludibacter sp.]|nr:cupin domain-containing protein [Paludibacter sp.]